MYKMCLFEISNIHFLMLVKVHCNAIRHYACLDTVSVNYDNTYKSPAVPSGTLIDKTQPNTPSLEHQGRRLSGTLYTLRRVHRCMH